jgi:retinal rod rhodopsin-sensitive cGMP 3',5'-cyclic phosphodiesterase subunit delta
MSELFSGFSISSIKMKDYETGEVIWKHEEFDLDSLVEAHIPKSILNCKAVSREINFSSVNEISSLSLLQKVKLNGIVIEEWKFDFGFVIPNSHNTWEQVIYAANPDEMYSADALSGNIIIETTFFQTQDPIHTSSVRIFYD